MLSEVLRVSRGDETDFEELADVLSRDPVLVSKIMRRASSVRYGGEKVNDIHSACVRIGWKAAIASALATKIYNISEKWDTGIDKMRFWKHSIEVALISRRIAIRLKHKDPDELYLCGLLHDLGLLVLDHYFPEECKQIWDKIKQYQRIHHHEERELRTNHAKIGGELLSEWGLPRRVCKTVEQHHNNPGHCRFLKESCIVALANSIASYRITDIRPDIETLMEGRSYFLEKLGLTMEDLQAIMDTLPNEMREEISFLDENHESPDDIELFSQLWLYNQCEDSIELCRDLLHQEYETALESLDENPDAKLTAFFESQDRFEALVRRFDRIREKKEDVKGRKSIFTDYGQLFDLFNSVSEIISEKKATYMQKNSDTGGSKTCTVWFCTNRQPRNREDLDKGFKNARDDKRVYYGKCHVRIPSSGKREPGSLGMGPMRSWLMSEDERLMLERIEGLPSEEFWQSTRQYLEQLPREENQALIYIHGYCTNFAGAAVRAAQLHLDLGIKGMTAFFSWASKNRIMSYLADESTIEGVEKDIEKFLSDFTLMSGARKVHLIAHSMGNRALVRAIDKIVNRSSGKVRFSQIILAAPDVDVKTFTDLASAYRQVADRTTLYVSTKDKALGLSKRFHKYARVGYVPPVTIVDGIDTVETSRVDPSFMGHNYYAGIKTLLRDMKALINNNSSPKERRLRRAYTAEDGLYWKII